MYKESATRVETKEEDKYRLQEVDPEASLAARVTFWREAAEDYTGVRPSSLRATYVPGHGVTRELLLALALFHFSNFASFFCYNTTAIVVATMPKVCNIGLTAFYFKKYIGHNNFAKFYNFILKIC